MRLGLIVTWVGLSFAALGCGVQRGKPTGASNLTIEAPVVRVMPSGAGALYVTVANATSSDDRLTSVDSASVSDAQLHELVDVGGVSSMREARDGFVVPAHGALVLERGGKHVMLFGVNPKDASVPLTLHFEHQGAVSIAAPMRSAMED